MIARAMSSRPLWILGYPDRAEARARETLLLARSQRQPMTPVFALLVTQGVHLVRGEAAQALTIGDEVVALCREFGLPQEREWSRSFQGAALAALGRLDEGSNSSDSLAVQRGSARPGAQRVPRRARGSAALRRPRTMRGERGFAHAEQHGEEGGTWRNCTVRRRNCCGSRGTSPAPRLRSRRPSSTRAGSGPARSSCAPPPGGRNC